MATNKIDFQVGFNVNQAQLKSVQDSLKSLAGLTAKDLLKINPSLGISKATGEAAKLTEAAKVAEKALNKAFNQKLGIVNLETFNKTLKQSGTNINEIYKRFSQAGAAGENAFRNLALSTTRVNMELKQSQGILDRMAQTLANTVKWNLASSAVNAMSSQIQQAYGFVVNLDSSLNDIRIVTGKSAEEMTRFAEVANTTAKNLKRSTRDYTDAALIYYQQGLGDKEAQARAETTLKAANVTGQTGAQVSELLTSVWNGYKVTADEAELYVDKLAAVAASTASDLEELSIGMSKVASAANAMGVDVDQLNAMLATIVSVTRQAPESVGTALKTIFARISDLKLGGADEEGVTFGKVSGQLHNVGIEILDANGDLREMGDVIEEVAGKWQTWDKATQIAIAQVMAGTRLEIGVA